MSINGPVQWLKPLCHSTRHGQNHEIPQTTMAVHEIPCQFMFFDYVLLNGTMVVDQVSLWTAMEIHGWPWLVPYSLCTVESRLMRKLPI